MKIKEIYDALGYESPRAFALEQMRKPSFFGEENYVTPFQRSGRSTFLIVSAISEVLTGRGIIVQVKSVQEAERLKGITKQMLGDLKIEYREALERGSLLIIGSGYISFSNMCGNYADNSINDEDYYEIQS